MKADHSQSATNQQSSGNWLRSLYLQKRQVNEGYSTRAFARDLGMSQSLLSLVMNDHRALTYKQIVKIAHYFKWDDSQIQSVLKKIDLNENHSVSAVKVRHSKISEKWQPLDLDRFKSLANWYHIGILDLITLDGFQGTPREIASRLGISILEVKDALDRLIRLGLLRVNSNGFLEKTSEFIRLSTQESHLAVRSFHIQMIQKAIDELHCSDQDRFRKRDISGLTLAIDVNEIEFIKKEIKKFKNKLTAHFATRKKNDLYQFNFQVFSLTKKRTNKKKEKQNESI